MNTNPCTCFYDRSEILQEKHGLDFHSDHCAMLWTNTGPLKTVYGMPLQTKEGKKLKRGQPRRVMFAFCPFCGIAYPKDEESVEKPEEPA